MGAKAGQLIVTRRNILFVCSRIQWRSPTAEAIYRNDDRVSARSRATAKAAVQTVPSSDLSLAHAILVTEGKHRHQILADFSGDSNHQRVHVLVVVHKGPNYHPQGQSRNHEITKSRNHEITKSV